MTAQRGGVARRTILDEGTVRLEYLTTGAISAGELHEMHATYAAHSPLPPAHLHPSQDERFEVLAGELLFLVDGERHRVPAGAAIEIPRGCIHQVRNDSARPATAIWQTRPALRTGEFLEEVARARDTGDLADLIEVITEYGDCFVLAEQPQR